MIRNLYLTHTRSCNENRSTVGYLVRHYLINIITIVFFENSNNYIIYEIITFKMMLNAFLFLESSFKDRQEETILNIELELFSNSEKAAMALNQHSTARQSSLRLSFSLFTPFVFMGKYWPYLFYLLMFQVFGLTSSFFWFKLG